MDFQISWRGGKVLKIRRCRILMSVDWSEVLFRIWLYLWWYTSTNVGIDSSLVLRICTTLCKVIDTELESPGLICSFTVNLSSSCRHGCHHHGNPRSCHHCSFVGWQLGWSNLTSTFAVLLGGGANTDSVYCGGHLRDRSMPSTQCMCTKRSSSRRTSQRRLRTNGSRRVGMDLSVTMTSTCMPLPPTTGCLPNQRRTWWSHRIWRIQLRQTQERVRAWQCGGWSMRWMHLGSDSRRTNWPNLIWTLPRTTSNRIWNQLQLTANGPSMTVGRTTTVCVPGHWSRILH